ncbi:unnamed protein product [Closterium sp. NIES-65]|nr:unnamed protein product [Closterium sp. NIES-65]
MAAGDLPWLFHILAVLLPIFITVTFYEKSLFAVHVALMTLAFLLVIPEGVFIVARPSRRRKEAMRLHLGLQLTGLVLALAGTLAMFTHRHARLKAHFSTPHAWLGVSAVILAELGGLLGVLLYFNTLRISRALIGRLHFLHRMVGRLVIICGFIAIILALKIFDAQNPRNKGWKTYVMACAVVAQLVGMSSLLYPSSPIAAAVSGSSSGGAAGSTVGLVPKQSPKQSRPQRSGSGVGSIGGVGRGEVRRDLETGLGSGDAGKKDSD